LAIGDSIARQVKLVHQPARVRGGVLRNLFDERAIVEAMNLLEFVVRVRAFEKITANLQHGRRPVERLASKPWPGNIAASLSQQKA
jgi:hypothetical protein